MSELPEVRLARRDMQEIRGAIRTEVERVVRNWILAFGTVYLIAEAWKWLIR